MQDPTDSDTMQITCKSVPISVGYEHNSCANRSSPSLTRECLMILPEISVEGSLNGHFSLTHSSIQVKSVLCYKRGLILAYDISTVTLHSWLHFSNKHEQWVTSNIQHHFKKYYLLH